MKIRRAFEKIAENLAFNTRQKQFCKFVEAVEIGDFKHVNKMLRRNPALVSVQCISPSGVVGIPSWLKAANPLSVALFPTSGVYTAGHLKIVDVLLQYGADPLSSANASGSLNVLDVFLSCSLSKNADLTDECSIVKDMFHRLFSQMAENDGLEIALDASQSWHDLQRSSPKLFADLCCMVEHIKSQKSKQRIESEIECSLPPSPSLRRKM